MVRRLVQLDGGESADAAAGAAAIAQAVKVTTAVFAKASVQSTVVLLSPSLSRLQAVSTLVHLPVIATAPTMPLSGRRPTK